MACSITEGARARRIIKYFCRTWECRPLLWSKLSNTVWPTAAPRRAVNHRAATCSGGSEPAAPLRVPGCQSSPLCARRRWWKPACLHAEALRAIKTAPAHLRHGHACWACSRSPPLPLPAADAAFQAMFMPPKSSTCQHRLGNGDAGTASAARPPKDLTAAPQGPCTLLSMTYFAYCHHLQRHSALPPPPCIAPPSAAHPREEHSAAARQGPPPT